MSDEYPDPGLQNALGYARHRAVVDAAESGLDCVVDRGPISTIVYSKVYDRELPPHAWEMLQQMDPVILYFTCAPAELAIRHTEDLPFENIIDTYDDVLSCIHDDHMVFRIDTSTAVVSMLEKFSAEIAAGETRI